MTICPKCSKVNGHPNQVKCMACGADLGKTVHLEKAGVTVWCGDKADVIFTTNVDKVNCLDCLRTAIKRKLDIWV